VGSVEMAMTRPPRSALALALAGRVAGFLGGDGAGGGYTPPAPICPAFKCSAGEKAAQKMDHQVWTYGCQDSGMNVFNMGDFDPVTGATKQKKNVDKCCVERDICKQTCGMTSQACHDTFQKCSQKICKEDQNCKLQAMMADMMIPDADEEQGSTTKYDPKEQECKHYNKGQAQACTCVPEDQFRPATEDKLKSFYKKYNPEKLDASGSIKDSEELWKKWEKKEPDLIMALTNKYKAKAVDRRAKPKRPEYKPPPTPQDQTVWTDSVGRQCVDKDYGWADSVGLTCWDYVDRQGCTDSGGYGSGWSSSAGTFADYAVNGVDASQACCLCGGGARTEEAEAEPPPPPPKPVLDADDEAFETKLKGLVDKKKNAAADEEYDLADEAKDQIAEMKSQEAKRLKAVKAKAIDEEDYPEAKRVKQRLAKLEEL